MVPERRRLLQIEPEDDLPVVDAAPWTLARRSSRSSSRTIPQAIGHRGYKKAFPENTMAAFRGAVEVGAHAVETDVHLSKDGVVVLSHDGDLKRCFGVDKKIKDCDWAYLSTLRTLCEPKEPMPRLSDLLEYLAQPELEKKWVLLDVKMDDKPEDLLTRAAETIASTPTSRPWNERIVFGLWNAAWIDHGRRILPDFPIAYIGFSIFYARRFLSVPTIAFNIFQKVLVGPLGTRFMRDARADARPLFVWTVNEEQWMEWSIRKAVDGVITDDPKLFLEVCERWEDEVDDGKVVPRSKKGLRGQLWTVMGLVSINVMVTIFATLFLAMEKYNFQPPKSVRLGLRKIMRTVDNAQTD